MSKKKLWKCPVCEGTGDMSSCICGGNGLIDELEAVEWQRFGHVIERLPEPIGLAVMPDMCHDCAFRKDSQERERSSAWEFLERAIREGTPFFCHQGMHCTSDGRYIPLQRDARGVPVGHPICAGWEAARAKAAT